MNQYGRLAQRQWKEFMPARYSMLDDPEVFFTQMGEDIAEEVSMLRDQLEWRLPPTQDYLQRVSDLNRVKRQAEEIVLNEMIYTQIAPESEHFDLEEQLEEVLNKLPSPDDIQERIDQIWEFAAETIEAQTNRDISEGVYLTDYEQEEVDQLTHKKYLIETAHDLSAEEMVVRIKELQKFR